VFEIGEPIHDLIESRFGQLNLKLKSPPNGSIQELRMISGSDNQDIAWQSINF
jgi:hypothetical protein